MPTALTDLRNRLAANRRRAVSLVFLAALHLAAFGILLWSEDEPTARAAFLLAWGVLNFFWLALLRRPLTSAVLSLAFVVILIVLSQFKHSTLMMTASVVDVMLIDFATFLFFIKVNFGLVLKLALAVALTIPLWLVLWRVDTFRLRRSRAVLGLLVCLAALAALSLAVPTDREDEFFPHQYVSKFVRSVAVAAVDLSTGAVLEADPASIDRLNLAAGASCQVARKLPHIVMVFDESSFDATMMPGISVPPNYRERFRSSDGKIRFFIVEGAGGPSWYTEYNVLTGLSARSYGRFADSVTRLAAGRVKRGLPYALRNCGYRTYSLYSWFGAFVGARNFHTSTGIDHFLEAKQLGSGPADTASFYYDQAARVIAQDRGQGPVFVFVYLAANHFPWDYHYRPDLLPTWVNPGNPFEIDEYLRRQQMSAHDYAQLKERLAREFPDDAIFIVRFGDHQPLFARG